MEVPLAEEKDMEQAENERYVERRQAAADRLEVELAVLVERLYAREASHGRKDPQVKRLRSLVTRKSNAQMAAEIDVERGRPPRPAVAGLTEAQLRRAGIR